MAEHLLAALVGIGLTDVSVEVSGVEVPFMDGSALPFVRAIRRVGVVRRRLASRPAILHRPVVVGDRQRFIVALPASVLKLSYFGVSPRDGTRAAISIVPTRATFEREIAPARTFGPTRQHASTECLRKRLGLRFALEHVAGSILPRHERRPHEWLRHKILDLMGDLAVLGRPLRAHVVACQTGHGDNLVLVRRIAGSLEEN